VNVTYEQAAKVTAAVEEALKRKRQIEALVGNSVVDTIKLMNPRYSPGRFHLEIGAVVDQFIAEVKAGEMPWYIVNAPPRHGKTETVGRGLPRRVFGSMPGSKILYATSTDDRAREVSNKVKTGVEQMYEAGIPHLKPADIWTNQEWYTESDNAWTAVGKGSATGGIGANIVVIDDVTGSDENARSKAFMESAYNWVENDILSRLETGGGVLLMETRRGLNDLAGWADSRYGGRFKKFVWPCRATEATQDWRQPGDFLWPERFGQKWFDNSPQLLANNVMWETLYQQNPIPRGGSVIHRDWIDGAVYYGEPADYAGAADVVIITVDGAAETKQSNDPTAIQVWAARGGQYFLIEALCLRLESPEVVGVVKQLASVYNPHAIVVENTSSGRAIRQYLERQLRGVIGHDVHGHSGDKVARMTPYVPVWAAGNVRICATATYRHRYTNEVTAVPRAQHDDEFDATTIALSYFHGLGATSVDREALLGAVDESADLW
jgi:predicted phage terminase large subunit-like protein